MRLNLPRLPAADRPALSEPAEEAPGPPPIPSVPAEQSAALAGPVRMRTEYPDPPRPNPHGRDLRPFRFGSAGARVVDPVPAATFLTPEPEPELDDSPLEDDE